MRCATGAVLDEKRSDRQGCPFGQELVGPSTGEGERVVRPGRERHSDPQRVQLVLGLTFIGKCALDTNDAGIPHFDDGSEMEPGQRISALEGVGAAIGDDPDRPEARRPVAAVGAMSFDAGPAEVSRAVLGSNRHRRNDIESAIGNW